MQYEQILELLLSDRNETVDFDDSRHEDSSSGSRGEEDGLRDGSVAWQGPRDSEFDDPWIHDHGNDGNQEAGLMNEANHMARLGLSSGTNGGRRRELPAGADRDMVGATPYFTWNLPHQ